MKNIKSLMLTLILGLGVILSTTFTSCKKEEIVDYLIIDIYKNQGSAHIAVDFIERYDEEHQIDSKYSKLTLIKDEVGALKITALEENTVVRINGRIYRLDKETVLNIFSNGLKEL